MPDPTEDQIIGSALAALDAGRAAEARSTLARAIAAGAHTVRLQLYLALACHACGDEAGRGSAIDTALELEPDNIQAVVMKAGILESRGEARAAISHLAYALSLAEQFPGSAELHDLAADARKAHDRLAARLLEDLRSQLRLRGFGPENASPRSLQALDLLSGQRQLFLQQPRVFYFPELPQRQFYDSAGFAWVPALEAQTDAIAAELAALTDTGDAFEPYLTLDPTVAGADREKVAAHAGWQAFFLWRNGVAVEENLRRCPATARAVAALPAFRVRGRAPSVLFSRLAPGARIAPHNGLLNTRLIGHLPLRVPPGCRLRVGNEWRTWERGKVLLFDDSIEHEARNDSERERVVLIFEIERPEMSAAETAFTAALLESVEASAWAGA